jgi:PIN like domain
MASVPRRFRVLCKQNSHRTWNPPRLGDDHVKEIKDALAVLGSLVQDVTVRARELNQVRLGEHASDAVLDRIDALFADEKSVGSPMEARELEDARAEAERRGREGIPPGYRDKNKVKGDPAGDYIIWRKVMDEAGPASSPSCSSPAMSKRTGTSGNTG